MIKRQFYHCGCCDMYHSINWHGDCREDNARFNCEELDEEYGWNGWEEIDTEEHDNG